MMQEVRHKNITLKKQYTGFIYVKHIAKEAPIWCSWPFTP